MHDTAGRTALVTGASGGIGMELANQAASDGYDVILTARRERRLEAVAAAIEDRHGVSASVRPKDLADPDAPADLFADLRDAGFDVDALVNVAGFPLYGRFDRSPAGDLQEMLQVNVVALTQLTRLFVEPMVERGEGAVLNVASVAAYLPMPRLAAYAATKAYVVSFSEGIAHELAGEGVQVTALCPGSVDTELFEGSELGDANLADSLNDPASVAAAGWEGLKAGDRTVHPSTRASVTSQLHRFLPRSKLAAVGDTATERS